MFLTFENIVGVILLGFPVLIGSAALPLLIRAPLVVGAALLGLFLTLEAQGLPIYERVLWRLRGLLRIRTGGGLIRPDDLAGSVQAPTQERALAVDGPVRTALRPSGMRQMQMPLSIAYGELQASPNGVAHIVRCRVQRIAAPPPGLAARGAFAAYGERWSRQTGEG